MKLKRINIRKYGPLENINIDPVPDFQIIFGKNETGKTLTVDALIFLLSGIRIKNIDRVGEHPDGEVVIDKGSKLITVTKSTKNPTAYLSIENPFDLKNIFIIRDSDLRIDDETDLLRRLVGIEGERLNRIRESLLESGRLSEKKLELSESYDHIRRRYDKAEQLVKEIDDYIKESAKEKIETTEFRLVQLDEEVKAIDERIHNLELTKKVDDYERLKAAFDGFRTAQRKYQELGVFNTSQLEMLNRYQQSISNKKEEKERVTQDIKKKETRSKDLIDRKEKHLSKMPEEGIEEKVTKIRKDLENLPLPIPSKFIKKLPYVFIPLLGVFTVLYLLTALSIPALVFALTGGVVAIFYFYGLFRSALIELRKKTLKKEAQKLGFEAEGDDLIASLYKFTEELNQRIRSLQRIDAELKIIKEELEEDQTIINRLKRELNVEEERLSVELRKLGIEKVEDFYLNMDGRENAERRLAECRQSLVDYFKKDDTTFWEHSLKELKQGASKIGAKYDPAELENLRKTKKEKQNQRINLGRMLDEHRSRLRGFERQINELNITNGLEDDFSIDSIDSLKRILSVVKEFITKIDSDAQAARKAIEILDSLQKEDETKLTDLLTDRYHAAKIFSEITQGRYQRINFSPEKKDFSIVQNNGEERYLKELSKGTFDQLYLSIRIALAEEMVDGPRFMIMDDPFLTSDQDRLKTQFEILKQLVDRGWQIIYFTVKEEVCQLARTFTNSNIIELSPL